MLFGSLTEEVAVFKIKCAFFMFLSSHILTQIDSFQLNAKMYVCYVLNENAVRTYVSELW